MHSRPIILLILICLPVCAWTQDSLLLSQLMENSYSIAVANGKISGSGQNMLQEAIAESQFVLIGEQHGIREVGAFTHGVWTMAHPEGYRYMVLETDPFVTPVLSGLLEDGIDALAKFEQEFPFSIPFYNNQDDFAFLAAANQQGSLWGLDQVFVVGARRIFAKLHDQAKKPTVKSMMADYLKRANEGFQAAFSTGQFDKIILNNLQEADFDRIKDAFPDEESVALLNGLEATQRIYNHYFQGRYYANNAERGQLMKQNFMNYYVPASQKGEVKAVLKFGQNHMGRGLTPTNIFDIGNTVSELAEMNGSRSLHIAFEGIEGQSFNALEGGARPFSDLDNKPEAIQKLWERKKVDWKEGEFLVIDMRSLRNLAWKKRDLQLKALVFNYDLLVLVPEAHAVRPLD
ncbi:MAG: hypothetical protein AAF206_08975 [Bacteroidota bacterium]